MFAGARLYQPHQVFELQKVFEFGAFVFAQLARFAATNQFANARFGRFGRPKGDNIIGRGAARDELDNLFTQCATPFDCYCVKSEREKLGQKLALS